MVTGPGPWWRLLFPRTIHTCSGGNWRLGESSPVTHSSALPLQPSLPQPWQAWGPSHTLRAPSRPLCLSPHRGPSACSTAGRVLKFLPPLKINAYFICLVEMTALIVSARRCTETIKSSVAINPLYPLDLILVKNTLCSSCLGNRSEVREPWGWMEPRQESILRGRRPGAPGSPSRVLASVRCGTPASDTLQVGSAAGFRDVPAPGSLVIGAVLGRFCRDFFPIEERAAAGNPASECTWVMGFQPVASACHPPVPIYRQKPQRCGAHPGSLTGTAASARQMGGHTRALAPQGSGPAPSTAAQVPLCARSRTSSRGLGRRMPGTFDPTSESSSDSRSWPQACLRADGHLSPQPVAVRPRKRMPAFCLLHDFRWSRWVWAG